MTIEYKSGSRRESISDRDRDWRDSRKNRNDRISSRDQARNNSQDKDARGDRNRDNYRHDSAERYYENRRESPNDGDKYTESATIADTVISLSKSCDVMAKTMQQLCELLQTNTAHISTCHAAANGACEKAKGVVINALSHYVNKQHNDTVDSEPLIGNDELRAKLPVVNEGTLDKTEPKSNITKLHAKTEQKRMNDKMKDHCDEKIKTTYQYKVEDRLYIGNDARHIGQVPKFPSEVQQSVRRYYSAKSAKLCYLRMRPQTRNDCT
jgi:hypothetical protein